MHGAMSVSSKRENTPPADDPSNQATAKKTNIINGKKSKRKACVITK